MLKLAREHRVPLWSGNVDMGLGLLASTSLMSSSPTRLDLQRHDSETVCWVSQKKAILYARASLYAHKGLRSEPLPAQPVVTTMWKCLS